MMRRIAILLLAFTLSGGLVASAHQVSYKKVQKAVYDALAKQRRNEATNSSSASAAAEAEARREREARETARRAEERRIEQARIQKAGDDYIRQSSQHYDAKKDEAHWQATEGKAMLREKTSMNRYFNAGTHITGGSGGDGSTTMPNRHINTTTNKSKFASKLKNKKNNLSKNSDWDGFDDGFFAGRTFRSLNSNPGYSSDFSMSHFRDAINAPAKPVTARVVSSPFPTEVPPEKQPLLNRMQDLAGEGFIKGKLMLLEEAQDRVQGYAKSTISGSSAMGKACIQAYQAISSIGDVKNKMVAKMERSLQTASHVAKTGDLSQLDAFFAREELYSRQDVVQLMREKLGFKSNSDNAVEEGEDFLVNHAFWRKWKND